MLLIYVIEVHSPELEDSSTIPNTCPETRQSTLVCQSSERYDSPSLEISPFDMNPKLE